MSLEEIETELVDFVCRDFMVQRGEFALDKSLIDQGVIDSFGLVEITTFMNRQFGISAAESEMNRDNFGSILKMVAFIHRKQHG